MPNRNDSNGALLHNLLLFGRLLHAVGLDVNLGRMIDLAEALGHIGIGDRQDFYFAARTLLVHNRDDLPLFDLAFALFWRRPGPDLESQPSKQTTLVRRPPQRRLAPETAQARAESDMEARPPVWVATRTYSDRELLRQKNFAELEAEELEAIKRLMRAQALEAGKRRTRRMAPGKPGWRVDLRRSLRKSYNTGGEILSWVRRTRVVRPRPLVIIADISGSMERYTRILLHFVYGLGQRPGQVVEAFVFSTRLTRITHELRTRNVDRALRGIASRVHDWSGGTRTGESLKTFNFQWGRRVLGRGAVVLIISDGWDRGDPALLAREMDRLHRTCHRLVWLNPLLGAPEYEPLTRGIRTALPHVDDFLPVHNLASLEALSRTLASLQD